MTFPRVWAYQIDTVRPVINSEDLTLAAKARKIGQNILDWVENSDPHENLAFDFSFLADDFLAVQDGIDVDDLDDLLNDFYDLCDHHDVWVGGFA